MTAKKNGLRLAAALFCFSCAYSVTLLVVFLNFGPDLSFCDKLTSIIGQGGFLAYFMLTLVLNALLAALLVLVALIMIVGNLLRSFAFWLTFGVAVIATGEQVPHIIQMFVQGGVNLQAPLFFVNLLGLWYLRVGWHRYEPPTGGGYGCTPRRCGCGS
jgi:hypothetical protein